MMTRQAQADRQAVERAVASLQALAGAGLQHVEITRVLGWLGVAPPAQPAGFALPELDPRADPITGCLPVTAHQPGSSP
jgi:hypothetical protein